MNGCSLLMLHNFLNSIKQAIADLSEPPAPVDLGPPLGSASLDSQFGFAWESPRIAQVADISVCFIGHAGWPRTEHK